MPPHLHRYRVFSHANADGYDDHKFRVPLAQPSEVELNEMRGVKKLVNKQKWAFGGFKLRSMSSPPLIRNGYTSAPKTEFLPKIEPHAIFSPLQNDPHLADPAAVNHGSVIRTDVGPAMATRVVVLRNIPANVGLNSVLLQASGGPLERVTTNYEKSAGLKQFYSVQLYFLYQKDAAEFFNYASSGRYLVNGRCYLPHKGQQPLKSEPNIGVIREMAENGARRCVVLKRHGKPPDFSKHKPTDPHYNVTVDVSLEAIRRNFSEIGVIVSVQPIVSSVVSISIQYADVRSAIKLKRLFESKDHQLYKKYNKWSISYGKDPMDKSCPASLN
ncbi:hypothetical protein TRVA0_004S03686 [Trichomonascus vanleenenianus]|uniref:Ssp2p n=1 Tax=Trichomonascus vanleenenianus TaxID=2268995 RepID=UPI003EC9AEF1